MEWWQGSGGAVDASSLARPDPSRTSFSSARSSSASKISPSGARRQSTSSSSSSSSSATSAARLAACSWLTKPTPRLGTLATLAVAGRIAGRTSTTPPKPCFFAGVTGRWELVGRFAIAERTALAPEPAAGAALAGTAVSRAVTSFHRSLLGTPLVRPPFFADFGRGGRGFA
eukprot:2032067-Prymnesium_polylepis.1